ncbi:Uncharacterised protein [Mycobacteroides abscessus subsp. abscessus]|nr:Uncharacterised protein [Mycobacteroides abscessus subsp. abscessus]
MFANVSDAGGSRSGETILGAGPAGAYGEAEDEVCAEVDHELVSDAASTGVVDAAVSLASMRAGWPTCLVPFGGVRFVGESAAGPDVGCDGVGSARGAVDEDDGAGLEVSPGSGERISNDLPIGPVPGAGNEKAAHFQSDPVSGVRLGWWTSSG